MYISLLQRNHKFKKIIGVNVFLQAFMFLPYGVVLLVPGLEFSAIYWLQPSGLYPIQGLKKQLQMNSCNKCNKIRIAFDNAFQVA